MIIGGTCHAPRAKGRRGPWVAMGSNCAFDHHLFDIGNGCGRVQALGAGFGAVHDGVAAVQFEWILKIVQTLACGFIAAVDDPAVGVQQRCWTEVAIAIPPVAGAGC